MRTVGARLAGQHRPAQRSRLSFGKDRHYGDLQGNYPLDPSGYVKILKWKIAILKWENYRKFTNFRLFDWAIFNSYFDITRGHGIGPLICLCILWLGGGYKERLEYPYYLFGEPRSYLEFPNHPMVARPCLDLWSCHLLSSNFLQTCTEFIASTGSRLEEWTLFFFETSYGHTFLIWLVVWNIFCFLYRE